MTRIGEEKFVEILKICTCQSVISSLLFFIIIIVIIIDVQSFIIRFHSFSELVIR